VLCFRSLLPFNPTLSLVCLAPSESGVGDGHAVVAINLCMWGWWRVLSERVMGMEWDGGEVPVGGEAIRDKDHRIRRWISGG
jgi:hypothetical protein